MPIPQTSQELAGPTLLLQVVSDDGVATSYRFNQPFTIGRVEECEVPIKSDFVSRRHASATLEGSQWWLTDLNSSNGLYVDGQRVERQPLGDNTVIRLGVRGPELSFSVVQPVKAVPERPTRSAAEYAQHYFGRSGDDQPAGEHTMLIRSAFAQVQKKQKRTYRGVFAALLLVVVGVAIFAYRQYRKANRERELAEGIFYSMKGLDLDVANLQEAVRATNNQQARVQLGKIESRRGEMEDSYNHFLSTLHIYTPAMTEEDRLILRVARIFGECELDMPKDFKTEVHNHIKYWQSSQRLARAIKTANENGYTAQITKTMMDENLPPQFFYLALQESDFNPYISGPETRSGIPKGMWQFIPSTAVKYGLKLGPLVDVQRPDVMDDRHHYDRETVAAGKYLKDLYGSDAQASGLLVMACYNWGQYAVLPLVRSMPANPRERNFWALLQKHRDQVPKETYDYVFYIVSAAVIGENPRLFGFNFDNPLANPGSTATNRGAAQPGSIGAVARRGHHGTFAVVPSV